MSLTLVQSIPYIIIVQSILKKWGIGSYYYALAKPRVHCYNQILMTRMQVVAGSLMSPNNRVQWYRLRPLSYLRWYIECPTSGVVSLDRSSENNPAPILRPRIVTPCIPISFHWLVRMMTTKVDFLCGNTCAFPVGAGTWLWGFSVLKSWSTWADHWWCWLPSLSIPS